MMSSSPLNIAIFASGNGSNARAVHAALEQDGIPARIALLVTHNPEAPVVAWMRERGVPVFSYMPREAPPSESLVRSLEEALDEASIGLVVLAGFMKLIPAEICRKFENKMLNVHPALIPSFCGTGMYGMRVHRAVWERGVKVTGATVHLVNEIYDDGPIVLQEAVPVRDSDTPETIAARVLEVEHRLLPEAVRLFAEQRLVISHRHVSILP